MSRWWGAVLAASVVACGGERAGDEGPRAAAAPAGDTVAPDTRAGPRSDTTPRALRPVIADTAVRVQPPDRPLREPPPRVSVRGTTFPAIAPGMEAFDGAVPLRDRRVQLTVVRVDPAVRRLALVAPDSPKSGGHAVQRYLENERAYAALSGGYMKSFYPAIPTGLVQLDSKPMNRPVQSQLMNGLFAVRGARVAILPYDGVAAVSGFADALQAGPLLVQQGRSALPGPQAAMPDDLRTVIEKRFIRSFVAIDANGRVLLGLSGEVTLRELVTVLTRAPGESGFGVRAAVNLSGHTSAGLQYRAGRELRSAGDVKTRLANAIVVR